jgi:hypothetical protein
MESRTHPPCISTEGRASLVDWLVQSAAYLSVQAETVNISLKLMDRYIRSLTARRKRVNQRWTRWIAGVCLLMGCKYMEAEIPRLESIFAFVFDESPSTRDSDPEWTKTVENHIRFLDTVSRLSIETIEVWILRAVDYTIKEHPQHFMHPSDHLFVYIYFQVHLDVSVVDRYSSAVLYFGAHYLSCVVQGTEWRESENCPYDESELAQIAEQIYRDVHLIKKKYPDLCASVNVFRKSTGSDPTNILRHWRMKCDS